MKKLLNVIAWVLALNFLAVVGGAIYLRASGRLDRERAIAIKDLLYPPAPTIQPTTHPSEESAAATQPILKLEELLAQQSGRSATEQVEFIQHTFDAQMSQLDRRQRELNDLNKQVDLAKQQLAR